MLQENERAIRAGLSVIPLKERSKAPLQEDWTKRERYSFDELKKLIKNGRNVGARLGHKLRNDEYLHVLDVDYDSDNPEDIADCEAKLDQMLEDWRDFPMVQSGSGGRARHIYFTTTKPFPSKKVARSDFDVTVIEDGKEKTKPAWTIELFGLGKQVAIPPSIHPDTGNAYKWLKDMDWSHIENDEGSEWFVDADEVKRWSGSASERPDRRGNDEDFLSRAVHTAPLGISYEEAKDDLWQLPQEWVEDRDKWLEIGMAIHHEFDGSDDGLDLFIEWSNLSSKAEDENFEYRWDSFKKSDSAHPKTWRSVKEIANKVRKKRAREEVLGDDEDKEAKDKKDARKWADDLEQTADGAFKSTVHNIKIILTNDARIRGCLAWNDFSNNTVLRKTLDFNIPTVTPVKVKKRRNGTEVGDQEVAAIRQFLETPRRLKGYGMNKVPERDLKDGITNAAMTFKFHPVRDYLTSLEWDGVKRMRTLFIDYFGCDDNEYTREIAHHWMVSAVARIFEPGHKFDFVPILKGAQGKRKSTFLEVLAVDSEWFGGLTINVSDPRQMIMGMMGKWLLELPELAGFSRNQVAHIKGFMSAAKDNTRLPWGRTNKDFPRQSVMMGTTNESRYLRDETGNRRYWPLETNVETVDIERLTEERDQLWAEAYERYLDMREEHPNLPFLPLFLKSKEAQRIAAEAQADAMEDNTAAEWASEIEEWFNAPVRDRTGFDNLDEPVEQRQRATIKQVWQDGLQRDLKEYVRENVPILEAALEQLVRRGVIRRLSRAYAHRVPGLPEKQRNVIERVGYVSKVGNPNFGPGNPGPGRPKKRKYNSLI